MVTEQWKDAVTAAGSQSGHAPAVCCREKSPLKVFLPRVASGTAAEVVLANSAGGVAGGDRLAVRAAVGEDTDAVVTTQAAEKTYRSNGRTVLLENRMTVGPRGRLAWVPRETILFDLDRDACLLAGEMWVFGRIARGEVLAHGLLHDVWRIRRGGRLVWGDSRFRRWPCCSRTRSRGTKCRGDARTGPAYNRPGPLPGRSDRGRRGPCGSLAGARPGGGAGGLRRMRGRVDATGRSGADRPAGGLVCLKAGRRVRIDASDRSKDEPDSA